MIKGEMVYILLLQQKWEMWALQNEPSFFRGKCSSNTGLASKQNCMKLMNNYLHCMSTLEKALR